MFALGVVFFIMCVGHPPFCLASEHDEYYSLLMDNPREFWERHLRKCEFYERERHMEKREI